MTTDTWFRRIRKLDIRLWAAAAATLMLVAGVMWVVPTTPSSKTFTFETTRRSMEHALQLEFGTTAGGTLVDGSDTEFYRFGPIQDAVRIDVHMANRSPKMIPGLRIFDETRNLIQDQTEEYVRRPGANIEFSFMAESNRTYFVQVLSQRNTIGEYSLTVEARQP